VRAAGPVVDPVPCSGCSKLIDPLRAGHVAIFDLRFHFFCGRACRAAFLGEAPLPLGPAVPPREPAAWLDPDEQLVAIGAAAEGDELVVVRGFRA